MIAPWSFSSGHVWMGELDYKESWALKNWCLWTVVLEKTLVSPLDCKEIQPVNPKGNQSWIFIGRTDAEIAILWPPNVKNWFIWKDPDAGKDWRREERGTTASLTQWMLVWASSRRWWRIGKPGVLQSMGSQSQTWLSNWTTTNRISYLNLLFKMFMIFQLAVVCSLCSLRLESPHLFPSPSLLMTPYPSS